jgi:two-component system, chemotaxis family, chemotaxis protein CheY
MRFLVVDDDFYCRELLKAIFSPYGTCDQAIDGGEAISMFRRALDDDMPYDVIFMDVIMPGLSGLETLDCIRQIECGYNVHGSKRVKSVIITGYYDPELSFLYLQKECESFLQKPFTPDQIMSMVREVSDEFRLAPARR